MYEAYGLRVSSPLQLPLPLAPHLDASAGEPDIRVSIHHSKAAPRPDGPEVYAIPCPTHGADLRVFRGPGGAWIWHQAIGTFHVSVDAACVAVYPEGDADSRAIGHGLVGPVLIYALLRRARPVLHAAGVMTTNGATLFLGPSGQGKTTLAAAFLRHGAALLSDDAVPVMVAGDCVYGEPGPAYMKVWRETAEHALSLTDELPDIMANYDKKLLALGGRYTSACAPAPIRAIYLLSRYDASTANRTDVTLHPLGQRDGLTALLAYTSNRAYLLPTEEAPLLPAYARLVAQAPVRILSYPSGFEHQDAVYGRVLADVEDV